MAVVAGGGGFSVVVDLTSEAVIFVFTCELETLESLEDNLDSLGGFGQHGLDRYPDSNMASILEQLMLITALH